MQPGQRQRGQIRRLRGRFSGNDAISPSMSIAARRFKNSSQHCRRRDSDNSSSVLTFLHAITLLRIAVSDRPCLRKIVRSAEFSRRNFSAVRNIDITIPMCLGALRLAMADISFVDRYSRVDGVIEHNRSQKPLSPSGLGECRTSSPTVAVCAGVQICTILQSHSGYAAFP